MRVSLIMTAVLALVVGACATEQVTKTKKYTNGNLLSAWPTRVKDKNHKFDLFLNLENRSTDKALLIFTGDMTCGQGSTRGQLRVEGDRRVIDLRPGEIRRVVLLCKDVADQSGDFVITVGKVYDNPTLDAQTPGTTVLNNISWKFPAGDFRLD